MQFLFFEDLIAFYCFVWIEARLLIIECEIIAAAASQSDMCLGLSSARANTCKWLSETRGSADGGDFSCKQRSVSGTIRERGKHKRTSWLTLVQSNNGEATSECGWQKKKHISKRVKVDPCSCCPA